MFNEQPDYIEGPQATDRFSDEVKFLLTIPHSVIVESEKAYRKQVDANPNRRGPKRKVKPSASPDPHASKDCK